MSFRFKVIFTVLIITASAAYVPVSRAQMTVEDMEKFSRQSVYKLHLNETMDAIERGEIETSKLDVIYKILSKTTEVYIHRMRGADDNQVYLHKDGHSEAVFDVNEELVKDGLNDGSYNYFHPSDQPLRHFFFDIHPWITWGMSDHDPTDEKERIRAYLADLEGGIRRALADEIIVQKNEADAEAVKWDRQGQVQALALFLDVIERGGAEELYGVFASGETNLDDSKILELLGEIEQGFSKIYRLNGL